MNNMIVETTFPTPQGVNTDVAENKPVTATESPIIQFNTSKVSQVCLMGQYSGQIDMYLQVEFSPDGTIWFTKPSIRKKGNGFWGVSPMIWQISPGPFCLEVPVCAEQCRVVAKGEGTVTLHVVTGRM